MSWLAIKIAFAEVAGFFVLLPACLCHAWTEPTYASAKALYGVTKTGSTAVLREKVDQWSWQWIRPWYDNVEDGVSGQQAWIYNDKGNLIPYASTYPSWTPKWVIAYGWSAWRNGANNLKRPLRNDTWT